MRFSLPRRFRIRTLLGLAAMAALLLAVMLPFKPKVSFSPLRLVAPSNAFYPARYQQMQVTVTNNDLLPVWCRNTDIPLPDDAWAFDANRGESSQVHIDIYKDECKRIASGGTRTYDIMVTRPFKSFRLFLDVRDWRGRTTTLGGDRVHRVLDGG